jgi:NAD(P)H-hydrate epimerase
MVKIVTSSEMRLLEKQCQDGGISTDALMENAGRAVATEVERLLGDGSGRSIVVLVGPGNNGGDGLVAAGHLSDRGERVKLYLLGRRPADNLRLKLALEHRLTCLEAGRDESQMGLGRWLAEADVVIDAVFGTGQSRPLGGEFAAVLGLVAAAREDRPELTIIAIDLPTGLNADSGALDPAHLAADHTITLGLPKLGLYSISGARVAGEITVVDIGIPPPFIEPLPTELITEEWVRQVLPPRPPGAHKGSFGRVLVAAGSINYIGAAYLACSGAVRTGAGLVTLATAKGLHPVLAAKLTEVTHLPLPEDASGIVSRKAASEVLAQAGSYDVLLMGCGLGQTETVKGFIMDVLDGLKPPPRLVLDADALNTLAGVKDCWHRLNYDAILTPHPGELSRLTGLSVEEIQKDRTGTARQMAARWGKVIVLKGARTVVAAPDGCCRISATANAGLASAGTGDVLAGVIAGLIAQGLPLFDAAATGVYLHATAGDMVKAELGDAGMTASDLLPVLPRAIKRIKAGRENDAAGR